MYVSLVVMAAAGVCLKSTQGTLTRRDKKGGLTITAESPPTADIELKARPSPTGITTGV